MFENSPPPPPGAIPPFFYCLSPQRSAMCTDAFFQGWRVIAASRHFPVSAHNVHNISGVSGVWSRGGGGGGGAKVPTGWAPWKLKSFSIYEIDNQASICLKHEEINTHPKCSSVFISYIVSGPGGGGGLMAPDGVQGQSSRGGFQGAKPLDKAPVGGFRERSPWTLKAFSISWDRYSGLYTPYTHEEIKYESKMLMNIHIIIDFELSWLMSNRYYKIIIVIIMIIVW